MTSLIPFFLQNVTFSEEDISESQNAGTGENENNISKNINNHLDSLPEPFLNQALSPSKRSNILLPEDAVEILNTSDPLYEKKKKVQELMNQIEKTKKHIEHHRMQNQKLEKEIEEADYKLNWAQSNEQFSTPSHPLRGRSNTPVNIKTTMSHTMSMKHLISNADLEEYYQFDNEEENDFNIIYVDESDSSSDQSGGEDSSGSSDNIHRTKSKRSSLFFSQTSPRTPRELSLSNSLSSATFIDIYSDTLQVNIQGARDVGHHTHTEKKEDKSSLDALPNLFIHVKVISQGSTPEEVLKIKGSKTKVIHKNANPIWDQEFHFPVNDAKTQLLHFEIWHQSEHPHVISEAKLPLSLATTESKNHILELKVGVIDIAIQLIPRGAHNFGRIKGVTKEKLISWLTPEKKQNRDLVAIRNFCQFYQTFMSPEELYRILEKRFLGPSEELYLDKVKYYRTLSAVRGSVGFFFHAWLHIAPNDFQSPDQWVIDCKNLMDHNRKSTPFFEVCSKKISEIQKSRKISNLVDAYFPIGIDVPVPPACPTSGMDHSALEIAQQLTLIEFDILRSIQPSEFIKQRWSKPGKETTAPHILRYIVWFNRMVHWFSTEILKADQPEKRAVILGKLIEIGMHFREFRNYNGIMELSSCFHSAAISRLRNTWALLPQILLDNVDTLSQIMSPSDNFARYREACRTGEPNFVPYLGLFLTDFTFLDDANADFIDGRLLNFEKGRMIAKRLKQFTDATMIEYDFKPNILLQKSLVGSQTYSENDLFRISKLAETGSADSKVVNRFDSKAFAKLTKSMLSLGEENISLEGDKLSKRDWQILLSVAQTVNFSAGDTIAKEGTVQQNLFKIKSGELTLYQNRVDSEGKPTRVECGTITVGEFFGEEALLDQWGASSYDYVVSSSTAEIYLISAQFVRKLFPSEAGFARRFYAQMACQLADILVILNQENSKAAAPKRASVSLTSQGVDLKFEKDFQDNQNKAVLNKFKLTAAETILRAAPAIFKKTITSSGHIFVTQRYVLFLSKSFGYDTKEKIDLKEVATIKSQETEITLQTKKSSFKFNVKSEQAAEVIEFIKEMHALRGTIKAKIKPKIDLELSATFTEDSVDVHKVLSPSEWDLILKGAKHVTYKKGEYIVKQGDVFQRINQVSRGCAAIHITNPEGRKIQVGHLHENELFGEVSFLKKAGASADVVAHSEEVDVTIIEGYFINKLFTVNPLFAGNFFRYLSCCLSKRISDRKKQLGWTAALKQ